MRLEVKRAYSTFTNPKTDPFSNNSTIFRPIWYAVNIDIQKNGSRYTADEADLVAAAKTMPFFTYIWQSNVAIVIHDQGALKWVTSAYICLLEAETQCQGSVPFAPCKLIRNEFLISL
ncbi:uncharacterized [Tachysurus ichikawai]